MENLRSGLGKRYPSITVRTMTKIGRQSGERSPSRRVEWEPTTSIRQAGHQQVTYRARGRPIDPVIVILLAGLAAEIILPWAVLWLSDVFFFDIPAWSQWLVFGFPPALTVLAMLMQWALRTRSTQASRARVSRHQGR
jgi:hypothetical protein